MINSGVLGIRINSGRDLDRLARTLRAQAGAPVQRKLHDGLQKATKPAASAVQRAALAIPVKGPKHTDLRKQIAAATRLSTRTVGKRAGITIRVSPTKMPDKKKALPYLMEGMQRWRHPVYGNRERWVTQQPHPYFYKTIENRIPQIHDQMGRVLDQIAEDLGK